MQKQTLQDTLSSFSRKLEGAETVKCKVCGKEAKSMSMATGIYTPCGHVGLTKEEIASNKETIRQINKMFINSRKRR